jgi:hypothetical protein
MSQIGEIKVLKREDILRVSDIHKELVSVPEWGGDVYVKGMTGAERDKFESSMIERSGKNGKTQSVNMANIRAKLVSLSVCDENGKRIFTEADVQSLSQKSAAALQKVFAVAQRLSGIGDDDVEELAEGLKESPFEGSPSD